MTCLGLTASLIWSITVTDVIALGEIAVLGIFLCMLFYTSNPVWSAELLAC